MPEHIPVLLDQVTTQLDPQAGDTLLDCTVGLGGHARAYLERGGHVVGLDADDAAIQEAREDLSKFGNKAEFIHGNFSSLTELVGDRQFDHILFDLGIGSHQLSDESRGFSFMREAPLTMWYGSHMLPPSFLASLNMLEERLGEAPDALEIIRQLSLDDLIEIIRVYGEESHAVAIGKAIKQKPYPESTGDLAERIANAVPGRGRSNPATKTFQALRLAVNRELEAIEVALPQALEALKANGKLAVISFHSLEDRIVKKFLKAQEKHGHIEIVTKKPIRATWEETKQNPRARSAKLRVATKTNKQNKNKHDSQHTAEYSTPTPTQ